MIPVISLALYVPIHSDEIAYKWFSGRYWLDQGVAINLFPHCFEQFNVKTPSFFIPTSIFYSWLYADLNNPLKLRWFGIVNFLFWLLLVWILCKRLFADKAENVFTQSVSLLCMGALPLMMILNRPEIPMLIGLTALLIIPLFKNSSIFKSIATHLSYALITLWFFPQHPKTLIFLPVFFVSLSCLAINRYSRLGLYIFTLYGAATAYFYHSKQTACPLNENIFRAFSASLLSPKAFITEPFWYFKQTLKNLLGIQNYLKNILFSNLTESNWLPPANYPSFTSLLDTVIFLLLSCAIISLIFLYIKSIKHIKKGGPHTYSLLVSGCLICSVGMLAVLQTSKNFYESTLVFPLLLIAGLFAVSSVQNKNDLNLMRKLISISTTITASISVFWLLLFCFSTLKISSQSTGPLANQNYSLSGFNWPPFKANLVGLAKKCGLSDSPELKHLLVDDSTYTIFMKPREPYHVRYLTGYWAMGIDSLSTFLATHRSSGAIVQCSYLPNDLLNQAQRNGDFCCLSKFN